MKKAYKYLVLLLLGFIFIVFLGKNTRQITEPNLQLYMLDIGQGDAIYIKTPGGQSMLVDAGRDRTVLGELGKIKDVGNSINILEISNPDLDHIGGFPFIMENYKVDSILSPGTNHTISAFTEIEKLAKQNNVQIIKPKQDQVLILDREYGVTYTILWPEGNVRDWERNSGSIVGLIEYGSKKILLTGDAPKEVEDEILRKYGDYLKNIDILKAGHHGSNTSTGERLVKWSTPKYTIISAGLNNRYGHPHEEVLNILKKYNIETLVTIDNGTIKCIIPKEAETICK